MLTSSFYYKNLNLQIFFYKFFKKVYVMYFLLYKNTNYFIFLLISVVFLQIVSSTKDSSYITLKITFPNTNVSKNAMKLVPINSNEVRVIYIAIIK